ncbi:MAG TPA: HEAT repeat domain-containing protein [Chryseolinea sp.]|nr:HEAT repeat domain-containing protein [Chryseolinea sp.]HPH46222.1 HEAT repeat domain-containing protein [Chryseolinea sp.]HPM29120.1 HEAT repeat domain-containing protein [Chryseolinea sp.]
MEKKMIDELIARYNASQLNDAELKTIEQLIESGEIELTDLNDLTLLDEQILKIESPVPSVELDNRFYEMLAQEKKSVKPSSWTTFFSWPELLPKLAFASIALLIGFFGGYVMQSPSQKTEVSVLTKEVSELKEMMMLSLLENESATDRLKAVNLTQEMDGASSTVTRALLQTLNNDDNVNVRLAALEALHPYVKDNHVREELIRSIGKQNSPLVQIALAELMAALQEKSSVKELEKVLKDSNTPKGVKNKIKQTIDVLT